MNWNLLPKITDKEIEQFPEINPVVLQLIFNRGLKNQDQVDEFLQPDFSQDIHDPYLFKDMEKAVERIMEAKKNKERVCIFGDYDVDGVTGSVILSSALKELDIDHFSYIPHRDKEGYGLNKTAVDKIQADKANLIITVDCGISNAEEVKLAKNMGMDTIIVDHHDMPKKLPEATAIIHCRLPKETYPFKMLSGGGTAFKLAQALFRSKELKLDEKDIEIKEKWLLDLVALSTVGDMMTLVGENRTLVKYGLVVLQKTKRLGLQKMYEGAGVDPNNITTQVIGWQINPRINAAGRLEHANLAFDLLTTDNVEKAITMSHLLNQSNEARQKATESSVTDALKQINEEYGEKEIPKHALVVFSEDWPAGIVGLVAGRLARKYYRPVYAITKVGSKYTGSGRGVTGFDVTEALHNSAPLLMKFGGHVGACGFSLEPENLEKFKKELEKYSKKVLKDIDLRPGIEVEAEIELKDFTWDLFESVEKFEPFGIGNEEPNFLIKDLLVKEWQTVGNDNKHLRLLLEKNGLKRKAIAFGLGDWAKDLKLDSKVDIVCKIGVNEWNGNRELQMTVQDMKIIK
ncbi:MAG: single-stranded-DNA-specific exonuclease RecJ [Candidatus Komeilibacteria bacterium]